MKNLVLSQENQKKFDVIKAVVEGKTTVEAAAALLDISCRQIYRLLAKYKQNGKAAFYHGNKGRKPKHAFSEEKKKIIADIYKNKYYDKSLAQAAELMAKHDDIILTSRELGYIVREFGITPPRLRQERHKVSIDVTPTPPPRKRRKVSIKSAVESVIGKLSASKVSWDNKNCLVFVVPCPTGFVPEGGL